MRSISSVTFALDQALTDCEDYPGQWCAILYGGTEIFCTGRDLAVDAGEPTARGGVARLIARNRTKPLAAAVEGPASGWSDARLRRAFRVIRTLPRNIGREMLLTGKDLEGERAERLGFVNRLAEPGDALDAAIELAEDVCANAPLAVRGALEVTSAAINSGDAELWHLSMASMHA